MSGLSFSTLQTLLKPSEKLVLTVTRSDSGLTVVLQPILGAEPKDASDEIAGVRALLATPLCVRDTAENLDTGFIERIAQFRGAREPAVSEHTDMLKELAERGKETANVRTAKRGVTAASPAKPAASIKSTVAKPAALASDRDDSDTTSDDQSSAPVPNSAGASALAGKTTEVGTADLFGTEENP